MKIANLLFNIMEKEKILEILENWNFWKQKQNTGIKRKEYLEKMEKFSKTGQIVSVIGVRRSGKSTLMLQFIEKLFQKGLKPKNTLYVNFEDPRFLGEFSLELLNSIYETYLEYLKPNKKPYIFLDEVQNVPCWEKFVRSLHERKLAYIFVSGSTSKLLSSEFGTVLTGRHLPIEIFPLSFQEFLNFKGIKVQNKIDLVHEKIKIKRMLNEYLKFGGFPQVVLSQEKKEILSAYFNDILTRDVIEKYKIKRMNEIKTLAKYYLTNISSLISFRAVQKFLKIPLYTIERFSEYLCSPYLIFFVKKFAYSLKEQQVNPRKVFSIDVGLRNIVSFNFSQDLGKIYENVVFLEFLKKKKEIYYWKDKKECDFLIKEKGKKIAYQVCTKIEDAGVKQREVAGLFEAMEKFNLKEGVIITQDYEKEEKVEGRKIKYIPLWKWLIKDN